MFHGINGKTTYYFYNSVLKPVLVANKNLIDYIFLLSLEFAQSHDLPMQLHTG